MNENSSRLSQPTSAAAMLLCGLLLAGMLFGVVRVSGAGASSWVASDNVVDEASAFFDDSYIHEIRLYFDDPNWYDTLFEGHDDDRNTEDPYFPARFVSHGIEIDPVGARFKGYSSFGFGSGGGFPGGGGSSVYDDDKKPFRIDFNMYDDGDGAETTFFGLKKLNLNNGVAGTSQIREKLFMDFASDYVPAPRSVFTRLYVNDEDFGLYLAMEHIDNTFVESRFGDDEDGNIYKVNSQGSLAYLGSDPELYDGLYELKNNDELNDWSGLIELTDVLTNTPISELPAQVEPILDVKSTMYSMALLDLFVSLDSYMGNAKNYYLYDRSDTGQFTHLLWDANSAFGGMGGTNQVEYEIIPPSTIVPVGPMQPKDPLTLTLIQNVMGVESYKTMYLRALAQMLREGFDAESIAARSQELADLIRNAALNDPKEGTTLSKFESGVESTVDFVESRAAYVNAQLNAYAKKTDIQLNDLMTVNQGTISDGQGDYDPWVELYNLGPGMVNTGSLFLTDELGVPNKWALPARNVDDGQFLLLWVDGESGEGAAHASFSLSADGGDLYLYWNDGSGYVLVDSVSYPQLDADVSFGRFPDGDGIWHVLDKVITPAESNYYNELPEGLVINEFMANNDFIVEGPGGDYPDWIELYNGGTEAVDLSGMYLTDDLSNHDKWMFPDGTVIEAGGFLVVWAGNCSSQGLLHASFGLNASGESVGLFAADGETRIDSVVFGEQFDDVAYGRVSDGDSSWSYLTATVGSSNDVAVSVSLGDPTQAVDVPDDLFINEFMANNDASVAGPYSDYPDWVELYNGGTEAVDLGGMYMTSDLTNPDDWMFPEGTVIEAGGFLVVWADNDPEKGGLHASFRLNASGESVALFARDGLTPVDSVTFGEQFDDVAYGRVSDGGSSWDYLTQTCGLSNALGEVVVPDGPGPVVVVPDGLVINEFMANNDGAVAGPGDNYPDWIELYNGGATSVDLGGMYLTDSLDNPDKWKFPEGTIIEAGGFLVVWADNASDLEGLHASFGLSVDGEQIGLFAVDGLTLIDSVEFSAQPGDVSYGRVPDGSDTWEHMLSPSPGWQNNTRQPGDELSVSTLLMLIGAVAVLSIVLVAVSKLNARRK